MDDDRRRQLERYTDEVEHYRRINDSSKSFTTPAIFTLILYFFGWVPGLIANIVYFNEANAIQKRTGKEPEGKGCLLALLILFGGGAALGVCLFFFAVLGSGS